MLPSSIRKEIMFFGVIPCTAFETVQGSAPTKEKNQMSYKMSLTMSVIYVKGRGCPRPFSSSLRAVKVIY
jgi:hypothetical protein